MVPFQDEPGVLDGDDLSWLDVDDDARPAELLEGELAAFLNGLDRQVWHPHEERLVAELVRVARDTDLDLQLFTLVTVGLGQHLVALRCRFQGSVWVEESSLDALADVLAVDDEPLLVVDDFGRLEVQLVLRCWGLRRLCGWLWRARGSLCCLFSCSGFGVIGHLWRLRSCGELGVHAALWGGGPCSVHFFP